MKIKMAWIMQTSRFLKNGLSIAIHLKLTKGHIGNSNILVRYLIKDVAVCLNGV